MWTPKHKLLIQKTKARSGVKVRGVGKELEEKSEEVLEGRLMNNHLVWVL